MDSDSNNPRKQLGELISTSYSSFTVESYQLNSTPPLGGLVVAESVLGVVCSARTEGLGPISAKGSAGDEDGSVYSLYPDLQRTLRSQFTALVAGCYTDTGAPGSQTAIYTYPECPPRVHYKCWLASTEELIAFTRQPDYLRLLLSSTEAANIDQVLIHLIHAAYKATGRDYQWLTTTAEYLGRQLKGQYDRLLAILKTLDALTAEPTQSPANLRESVGNIRL
ncbi:MAG: hypothetical protein ACJ78Q_03945 [Chloroflexia bacterium]